VTVDNTPPQARISYPLANAKIKPINGQVTLSAEVSDQVGISRVEWWLDGKKIAERTAAPYTILWASTRGNHALQVKAWDTAGNLANSETIPFEIIP